MPTYKVGPGTVMTATPPTVIRPLICEQCLGALGNVRAVAEYAKIGADLAAATWPEMAEHIRWHEAACPALKAP
jgi:hypothetical protein